MADLRAAQSVRLKPLTEAWLADRRLARDASLPPPAGPQLSTYVASRRVAREKEPESYYPPHRLAAGTSAEKVFAKPELLERILLHLHPQHGPARMYVSLYAVKELFALQRVGRSFRDAVEGSVALKRCMGIIHSALLTEPVVGHSTPMTGLELAPYLGWQERMFAPFESAPLQLHMQPGYHKQTSITFELPQLNTLRANSDDDFKLGMRGCQSDVVYNDHRASWRRILVAPSAVRMVIYAKANRGLNRLKFWQMYDFGYTPESKTKPSLGTLGSLMDELQLFIIVAKKYQGALPKGEYLPRFEWKYMDEQYRVKPPLSPPTQHPNAVSEGRQKPPVATSVGEKGPQPACSSAQNTEVSPAPVTHTEPRKEQTVPSKSQTQHVSSSTPRTTTLIPHTNHALQPEVSKRDKTVRSDPSTENMSTKDCLVSTFTAPKVKLPQLREHGSKLSSTSLPRSQKLRQELITRRAFSVLRPTSHHQKHTSHSEHLEEPIDSKECLFPTSTAPIVKLPPLRKQKDKEPLTTPSPATHNSEEGLQQATTIAQTIKLAQSTDYGGKKPLATQSPAPHKNGENPQKAATTSPATNIVQPAGHQTSQATQTQSRAKDGSSSSLPTATSDAHSVTVLQSSEHEDQASSPTSSPTNHATKECVRSKPPAVPPQPVPPEPGDYGLVFLAFFFTSIAVCYYLVALGVPLRILGWAFGVGCPVVFLLWLSGAWGELMYCLDVIAEGC